MARSRYSQIKLYKDAEKLLGGKGVAKRVVPISAKKTGFDTNEGMYADILAQLGGAYSDKLADKLEKADLAAARRMRDDYLKPQKDWNVEKDGTTPDALRAATMPGALTGNVGATYDPNVKPFPEEDFDDGTDTVRGMAAALGAPNAALGSPLDPGQPYAVGTDEEGDDANWMNPAEHKAFYENEAVNAQQRYKDDNPTGMDRVNQGEYGSGAKSGAMRNLLLGDAMGRQENDAARALKVSDRDELRAYTEAQGKKEYGRDQATASALAAANVAKASALATTNADKARNKPPVPGMFRNDAGNWEMDPAVLKVKQQIASAGAPGYEKAENAEYGKGIVKRENEVYVKADAAKQTMAYLDLAKSSVNDNTQTSSLGTILSETANRLGVPLPDNFEAKASKAQNFNAMMGNILANKLAAQSGPQTDSDAARMERTLANLGNTPESRIFMLDSARAMSARELEEGRFYSDYRAKKGTIDGAENAWRNKISKRPLFGINKKSNRPVFYNQYKSVMMKANPSATEADVELEWIAKYGGNR